MWQGIAYALAAEGVSVVAVGCTRDKLDATCAEIRQRGGSVRGLVCDADGGPADRGLRRRRGGAPGWRAVLVNNAQQVPLGRLLNVSNEAFGDGFASGPLAAPRLMRASHPHLKGDRVIVNLASSAAVRWDAPGYGAYAAGEGGRCVG
jgi:meso-butanediol dehydrogenase/(S,S)-butanediol dehydrogenase/diacetyl reductase